MKGNTMIEFIIYNENEEQNETYKKTIEKVMMNYDEEYQETYITSYKSNWKSLLEKETFKIYILDIRSIKNSGIDIARYIRENQNDWQSMIIMISTYEDYQYELLKYRLMIIDYIVREKTDYIKRLTEAIRIAINNYDYRPKTLKYIYKNTHYNIELSKIIYIEKEQESKRCIIKTATKEYYSPGNLHQLEQKLDKRFIKCSRSYIINIEQVREYNTKDNIIIFNNEEGLNIVSRDKRKVLINLLRGL
ncbi:MAG: hypothetical protein HFE81_07840 [Bacilli bacterium]|nr:hypothetical protein [Bacilli bacterium]